MSRKNRTYLIPQTPQMQKKKNISLVKDLCGIAKLRQQKSKDLKDAVKSLRNKYGSLRSISARLGLTWGEFQNIYYYKKVVKSEYVRKIDEQTKQDIQKFYLEGPITISLPEAQYANTLFLNRSLREACYLFNQERSSKRKVALSTFTRHRPKRVKLQGKIPIASSLCDCCTNFKLFGQALSGNGIKGIITGGRDAVRSTVCQYEHLTKDPDPAKRVIGKFGFRKCIFRSCAKCGVFLLRDKIKAANEMIDDDRLVQWHEWKSVKKVKKGVEIKRVEKLLESGKLCELLDKYFNAVEELSAHLFQCNWQYEQIARFKENLQEGHMLCSHDFAKNINCYQQKAVAQAFYNNKMVTLHASVCFHRCEQPLCNHTVRHEIIHLTPVLNHNAGAFRTFHRDSVSIIEAATGIDFSLILNVTDQAPSQYKNRNAFLFMSEYHKPVIHMFLGSRHGKFYSDQAAGRFLQFLRREIASERVHINSAQDVASVALKSYATHQLSQNKCQHFRISINLVQKIGKQGDRSVRIEHTREFHIIRNTGIPGLIQTRDIGCLCLPCVSGKGSCQNEEFFEEWSESCVAKRISYGNQRLFWPLGIDAKMQNSESQNSHDKNGSSAISGYFHEDNGTDEKRSDSGKSRDGVHSNRYGGFPVFKTKTLSWSKVLKDMEALPNYNALARYCSNLLIPPLPNEFRGKYAASKVDMITVRFVGIFPPNHYPISVAKDGNCFTRCISKCVFNSENQHEQIRVRLIMEAISNEDKYLDNSFLRIGVDQLANVDLVEHYSTYSDQYHSGMTLNDTSMRGLYRAEWYNFRLLHCYAGCFQFHSAASVLNRKVVSHYSATGVMSVHRDLNRPFFPVSSNDANDHLKVCHIQWTKSNENSIRLEHFVPLLSKE